MKNRCLNNGMIIIAAVLLVAVAFAGAASATEISANDWNKMGNSVTVPADGIYTFNDSDGNLIYPKYNASTGFTPSGNLILDFTNYHGTFYGEPNAGSKYKGALFGYVDLSGVGSKRTLEIRGLTLTNVIVNTTSGDQIGGIVGYFRGDSATNAILNFTDCRLENCDIVGASGSNGVGGLAGYAYIASLNVADCKVLHCDVVAGGFQVGGLVGAAYTPSIVRCNVTNSTIASTGSNTVGGLIGYTYSPSSFEMCGVENTSVYAASIEVGGLVGYTKSMSKMGNCCVMNCVIASGNEKVGGLVGSADSALNNVIGCLVEKCTIAGSNNVGGLVGVANSVSGCSGNSVELSSVKGTGSNVRLDCGNGKNLGCTADVNTNFINNGTITDTITLFKGSGDSITLPDATLWKTIYNATGAKSATPTAISQVTHLGEYGDVSGYGYCLPPCTVTYDGNGNESGSVPVDATEYDPNAVVTVLGNTGSLAKTGYDFTGWNKDSVSGTLMQAGDTFQITANTVIYANWTPHTYNVTFHANNGTAVTKKQQFTYDVAQNLAPNTFIYPGYTFVNWSTTAAGTGTNYTDGQSVRNLTAIQNGNVDLHAQWKPNETTVTFHTDAGTEDKLNTFAQPVNFSATPVKTGYVFTMWNVSSSGKDLNSNTYVKNGNWNYTGTESVLHAYANWTLPPYVEVSDWDQLVANVSVWTDTATMRTVVLTNTTNGAYKNATGTAGQYDGIPVTGNITIKPALNIGEIRIDGNQRGRIFDVSSTGTLLLAGNGTAILNVTGGTISTVSTGGAVNLDGGNLTLAAGAKITNSTSGNGGGAVYLLNSGTFTMNGGTISGCGSGTGAGVLISTGTFTMNSGEISACTASINGGGVFVSGGQTFTMNGGTIKENTAPQGAGLVNLGAFKIDGPATIAADNDVALRNYSSAYHPVETSASFTGSVGNITLYDTSLTENPEHWKSQIIVRNGSAVKNRFVLSSQYTGYKLTERGSDLVLGVDTPTNSIYAQLLNAGSNAVNVTLNTSGGTHIETKRLAAGETNVTFSGLANGVYSIEGYYVSATGSAGVTKLVTLSGSEGAYVELRFPEENVTSEVNTTAESGVSAPKIVVDGLDVIAAAQPAPAAGSVTLVAFNAAAEPYNATNEEQAKLKENITSTVPNAEIKYLNFSITKSDVDTSTGNTTNVIIIPDPATLMTIYMEYDLNGRENLQVWRIHGSTAEEFHELPAGVYPDDGYYACDGYRGIYIYSKHFSTYSVSSSLIPRPSGPTGGSSGYSSSHQGGSMWVQNPADVPTVAPTTAPAAPVADQPATPPTQKSPAPVAGLIVGLGIAAVLLRLRK